MHKSFETATPVSSCSHVSATQSIRCLDPLSHQCCSNNTVWTSGAGLPRKIIREAWRNFHVKLCNRRRDGGGSVTSFCRATPASEQKNQRNMPLLFPNSNVRRCRKSGAQLTSGNPKRAKIHLHVSTSYRLSHVLHVDKSERKPNVKADEFYTGAPTPYYCTRKGYTSLINKQDEDHFWKNRKPKSRQNNTAVKIVHIRPTHRAHSPPAPTRPDPFPPNYKSTSSESKSKILTRFPIVQHRMHTNQHPPQQLLHTPATCTRPRTTRHTPLSHLLPRGRWRRTTLSAHEPAVSIRHQITNTIPVGSLPLGTLPHTWLRRDLIRSVPLLARVVTTAIRYLIFPGESSSEQCVCFSSFTFFAGRRRKAT